MTEIPPRESGLPDSDIPILAAKLSRPLVQPWQIARPRLDAALAAARQKQVSLIKAAAGFGKTSMGAAWADRLKREGAHVAWVSLDAQDNEPTRFFFNLARSISRACNDALFTATDLIQDPSLVPSRTIAVHILNGLDILGDRVYLFLDDFHVIASDEIQQTLTYLLHYAPAEFHLILLSRSEPALPLADLRAKNRLFELDSAALGFDLDEVAAFLAKEGLSPLAADKLARLRERTEGWPAILRILTLTVPGPEFEAAIDQLSGSLRPVRRYLSDLLEGLPRTTARFLMRLSVLDRFTADLCDAVTGHSRSSLVLEKLERDHLLLIPLDAEGRWYRFHPLLLEHLRQVLADEEPGQAVDLHRRAAEWHARQGLWTDAIGHAFAAGDAEQAAGWVRQCAMPLVRAGDLLTLLSWQRLFPAAMQDQVDAKLAIAWGYALAARLDEAMTLTAQALASLEAAEVAGATRLRSECDAIQAVIFAILGDADRAVALAECAQRTSDDAWTVNAAAGVLGTCHWRRGDMRAFYNVRWPPISPEEARRNASVSVYRLCLFGVVEFEQLNVALAERHYEDARRQSASYAGPQSSPAAFSASLFARLRYEQGQVDEAVQLIDGQLSLISASVMLDCAFSAYVVLARAAAGAGDLARAHAVLDHGEATGSERNWGPLLAAVLGERLRLLSLEGRTNEMAACVDRLGEMAERTPHRTPSASSNIPIFQQLALATFALHTGRSDQAVEIFGPLFREFVAGHNQFMALRLAGQYALALLANRQEAGADEVFRFAIGKASRSGLTQPILDLGAGVETLLHRFVQGAPNAGVRADELCFVEAVMSARQAGHFRPIIPIRSGKEGGLTARERRVLELIAAGESNKEIARTLGITAETVKSHVKHIFTKLDVDRRVQAVLRARQLGYLSGERARGG